MTHSLKNPAQALGAAVIHVLGSSPLFVVLACLSVLGLYVPEYLASKVLSPAFGVSQAVAVNWALQCSAVCFGLIAVNLWVSSAPGQSRVSRALMLTLASAVLAYALS